MHLQRQHSEGLPPIDIDDEYAQGDANITRRAELSLGDIAARNLFLYGISPEEPPKTHNLSVIRRAPEHYVHTHPDTDRHAYRSKIAS